MHIPTRPVVHVAVGVVFRDDGAVLLADRPAGKPYAGYWEFPGGKVEPGESVAHALTRELDEELGIQVTSSTPWITLDFDYPHAYVRLYFRWVTEWSGQLRSREGQRWQFSLPGTTPPDPLLPAAIPIWQHLAQPRVCVFSPRTSTALTDSLAWLDAALARGARLLVWDESQLGHEENCRALPLVAQRLVGRDVSLFVSSDCLVSGRIFSDKLPGPDKRLGVLSRLDDASEALARSENDDFPRALMVHHLGSLKQTDLTGYQWVVCLQWPQAGAEASIAVPVYLGAELTLAQWERARQRGAHGLAVRDLPPQTVAPDHGFTNVRKQD
jgi:8-oxo-dGTP diphosphatase